MPPSTEEPWRPRPDDHLVEPLFAGLRAEGRATESGSPWAWMAGALLVGLTAWWMF